MAHDGKNLSHRNYDKIINTLIGKSDTLVTFPPFLQLFPVSHKYEEGNTLSSAETKKKGKTW